MQIQHAAAVEKYKCMWEQLLRTHILIRTLERHLAGLKMTLDQRVGKPCVCCEMSTLQPPSNLKLLEGSELYTTPGIDPDPSKCLMNFKQQTVLVS